MKYPNDPMHPFQTVKEIIQASLVKDKPLTELPTIKEFYAGQEIFVTGASGFMGKVLIEKLLRSCPDIKTIYVLLRPKRGKPVQERLEELMESQLYEILRMQNPEFHKKIIPIAGDATKLKLGISEEDLIRLENISIIFHAAATVRFDEPLKNSVLMNTRGTRELMEFAEKLKNIRVVVHISTSYSNVYIHTIEERIYPAPADWKKTIEICETLDDNNLNFLTQHFINFMPNTYVFTKNLAEHVVDDYKDRLPVVIFRPSVVVGASKEPLPGWVDNVNGPMGILLASTLGFCKTMHCDPQNVLDMIPVDVCTKALIIAAWKRAHEPRGTFDVYNSAAGGKAKITIKQILDIGIYGVCEKVPMEKMIWQPDGGVTRCKFYNFLRVVTLQLFLAFILDLILRIKKQEPKLMKIQRKMFEANLALTYFVTNNWTFKNEKFVGLASHLRDEDVKDFEFRDSFTHDMVLSIHNQLLGYRRFLLMESDDTLPQTRERFKYFQLANQIVKAIPFIIVLYYSFVKYNIVQIARDHFAM